MTIADNGKGFNLEETNKVIAEKGSLGLIGMQERAELIGANLSIKSRPEKGTTISVELDCK
jgi:signal transduction histidine kinase